MSRKRYPLYAVTKRVDVPPWATPSELPAPAGSANVARENGIKEIRYLCDEALDHQMGWKSFCEMVKHRLEIETAFVEMASSPTNCDYPTGSHNSPPHANRH